MCCAVLCCADVLCRLPYLSTVGIQLDAYSKEGDLDPVLASMHMHASGLRSLNLQLDSSWTSCPGTWASLGKLTNLTQLQLTFNSWVRVRLGRTD